MLELRTLLDEASQIEDQTVRERKISAAHSAFRTGVNELWTQEEQRMARFPDQEAKE